jgi:UDPglucose 6-dehydrogenase
MGLDPRIGSSFLRAGIGYGGSCFPKDVAALKQLAGNSGYHFQLLTSVIEVNELQKRRVITKLKKHLGSLDGKLIALLGLSFKPGTSDMREAASLVLAARLIAEGAQVRAYDPVVGPNAIEPVRGVSVCPSPEATIEDADAAVLVTEWPALVNLDWPELRPLMRQPVIVDGRNALSPQLMAEAGYVYEGIGRVVAGPADASEERGPAATVGDPQT